MSPLRRRPWGRVRCRGRCRWRDPTGGEVGTTTTVGSVREDDADRGWAAWPGRPLSRGSRRSCRHARRGRRSGQCVRPPLAVLRAVDQRDPSPTAQLGTGGVGVGVRPGWLGLHRCPHRTGGDEGTGANEHDAPRRRASRFTSVLSNLITAEDNVPWERRPVGRTCAGTTT